MDILKSSYIHGRSPLSSEALDKPFQICLFGKPISQSLSPLLHSILFRSNRESWNFYSRETTDPTAFQERLNDPNCIGTSITMPNKVAFFDLLDELTEEATAIGAVNTSFVRLDKHGNRRHVGTNTDCIGIREAILNQAPLASKAAQGRPVLVIGGGGAARSAIYTLWRWFGPSKIYIANRLKSEIDALVQFFQSTAPEMRLHPIITVEEARCINTPYIVVGTIPDNPPRESGEILCRQICDTILRKDGRGIFLDMCYLPSPMTRLYTSAAKNGWQVVSGTDVLMRVCIAQQTLWLERNTNEAGMKEAMSALWEITQSQHTSQNSKL